MAEGSSSYYISDAGGLELLLLAAEATDRAASLREVINADGVMVPAGNGAMREHPALRGELAAQAFAARTLARLGLDVEPVQRIGRPSGPTTGSDRAGSRSW